MRSSPSRPTAASLARPECIERVRRAFARASVGFAAHSAVFENVGRRLDERLALLAIEPRRVLDLGSRNGYRLDAIAVRYPDAEVIGLDPFAVAPAKPSGLWRWLKRGGRTVVVSSDPHRLPFADASFDIVTSNLLLPWCASPATVFAEVARVLTPSGAFLFTTAGPDTMIEYRRLWAGVDAHPHVFGLTDMHDLGDSLLTAGIAAPVLDRENIVVDYPSVEALEHELRALGASNLAAGRRRGLMAPTVGPLLESRRNSEGRFEVTLELVHGHGWKGMRHDARGASATGEVRVSLDTLRPSRGR